MRTDAAGTDLALPRAIARPAQEREPAEAEPRAAVGVVTGGTLRGLDRFRIAAATRAGDAGPGDHHWHATRDDGRRHVGAVRGSAQTRGVADSPGLVVPDRDRKSTRLNSSHMSISYAVFC